MRDSGNEASDQRTTNNWNQRANSGLPLQGIMGLIISIISFAVLLAVEPTKVALTEGEQHWRRQMVTLFSCIFNVILAVAGFGLAAALGIRVPSSLSLITPLVLAAVQA